jgi:Fur family transcriptional regulator, ferric uptake regulator
VGCGQGWVMTSPRSTRQRQAIASVLTAAERPLTPPEILAAAQVSQPGLGIATVYRALRDGQAAGEIRLVEAPGGMAHYEPAHHEHHHHFHCTECGKLYEVHGCPGDLARLAPSGFIVAGHEITLSGICATCAKPMRLGKKPSGLSHKPVEDAEQPGAGQGRRP